MGVDVQPGDEDEDGDEDENEDEVEVEAAAVSVRLLPFPLGGKRDLTSMLSKPALSIAHLHYYIRILRTL